MSNGKSTVDTRIVEMEFDNKDFEKGAKETLQTLDDLKKSLNFEGTEKGFKTLQNGIDSISFKGLTNDVETVANAFGTLAGRIKVNFFDRISNMILDAGQTLVSSTFGQIVTGGKTRAMNIAQSKFKLEGMGVAWEEIADDIDYAVSGTAYGLDAAATIAAQLTASGIRVGEEMKTSLRGVSGIAAMTSSEYEEIGQIFAAVAGQGRLMGMQLNQLSLRGINAAATLAEQLGYTEAEIRELVSKGEIDFMTFATAMDNAFGEHAKEANKTFTGSMSNIKAALSRLGEIFYDPFYDSAILPLNQLRTMIAEFVSSLKASDGKTRSFAEELSRLMHHLGGIATILLKKLNPMLVSTEKKIPDLTKKLKRFTDDIVFLRRYLRSGNGFLKFYGARIVTIIETIQTGYKVINAIFSGIKRGLSEVGDSMSRMNWFVYSLFHVIEMINKLVSDPAVLSMISDIAETLTKVLFGALLLVSNTLGNVVFIITHLFPVFKAAINLILAISGLLMRFFNKLFDAISFMYNLDLSGRLQMFIGNLARTINEINISEGFINLLATAFVGLATIIQTVSGAIASFGVGLITGIVTIISTVVSFIVNNIDIFAELGRTLLNVAIIAVSVGKTIVTALEEAFGMTISAIIIAALTAFSAFIRLLVTLGSKAHVVTRFIKPFASVIASLFYIFKDFVALLATLFNKDKTTTDVMEQAAVTSQTMSDSFGSMAENGKPAGRIIFKIVDACKVLAKVFENLTGITIGDWLTGLVDKFKEFQQKLTIEYVADKIGGAVTKIRDGISELKQIFDSSGLKSSFETFIGTISEFRTELFGEKEGVTASNKDELGSTGDGPSKTVMVITSLIEGVIEAVTATIDGWTIIIQWITDRIKALKNLFKEAKDATSKAGEEGEGWLETVNDAYEEKLLPKLSPLTILRNGVKQWIEDTFDFLDFLLNHLIDYIGTVKLIVQVYNSYNVARGIAGIGIGFQRIGEAFKLMSVKTGGLLTTMTSFTRSLSNSYKLRSIATILISFELFLVFLFAAVASLTSFLSNASDDQKQAFDMALNVIQQVLVASVITLITVLLLLLYVAKQVDVDGLNSLSKGLKVVTSTLRNIMFGLLTFAVVFAIIDNPEVFGMALMAMISVFIMLVLMLKGMMLLIQDLKSMTGAAVVFEQLSKAISAMSKFMIKSAIAFSLILLAIHAVDQSDFDNGMGFVLGLMSALLLIMYMIIKTAQTSRGFQASTINSLSEIIAQIGRFLVLVALTLWIMSATTNEYGGDVVGLSGGALLAGLIGLFLLVGALSAKAKESSLSQIAKLDKMISSIGKMFLALSGSLVIIAIALKIIDGLDHLKEDAITLVSIFGALALVFAALLWVTDKTTPTKEDFLWIGIAMLAMGGVLWMISKALNDIALQNVESLKIRTIALGGLFLTLGAVLAGLTIIAGVLTPNWKTLLLMVGGGMVLMAATLFIIGRALSKIGNVDDIKNKAMALGALLVVLAVVMAAFVGLSTLSFGPGGLILIAAAFVLLSSSLIVLAKGLQELGKVDFENIVGYLKELFILSGAMAVMGLAAVVLGAGMAVLGNGLGVAAVPLLITAIALKKLSKVKFEKIAEGLGTICKLAGALMLLGLAGVVLGAGAVVLAVGLAALIVPLALIVPIMLSIRDILDILANKGPELLESIDGMIDRIPEMAKSFGKSIVAFAKEVANGIVEIAPIIGEAFTAILTTVINTMFNKITIMAEAFVRFVVKVLDIVAKNISPILSRVWIITVAVLKYLDKNAETLGYFAYSILANIISGMLKAYSENIGDITEKFFDAVIATIDALAALFDDEHQAKLRKSVDRLMENVFGAFSSWFGDLGFGAWYSLGSSLISAIAAGMEGNWAEAGESLKKAVKQSYLITASMFTGLPTNVIEDLYDTFTYTGEEDMDDLEEANKTYEEALKKAQENLNKVNEAEEEHVDAIQKGKEAIEEVRSKQEEKTKGDLSDMDKIAKKAKSLQGYLSGIGQDVDLDSLKGLLSSGFSESNIKDMAEKWDITQVFGKIKEGWSFDELFEQFNLGSSLGDLKIPTSFSFDTEDTDWTKTTINPEDFGVEIPVDGYSEGMDFESMLNGNYGVEGFDLGTYDAEYSQQVNTTVSAELNDETVDLLNLTREALNRLSETMDGVMIVSDGALIGTQVDLDSAVLADSVVPFVDAALAGSRSAAKGSRAHSYK